MRNINWRRTLKWSGLGLVGLFLIMQAIPYGRDHTNPAVTAEAPWPNDAARTIAVEACYD